MFRGLGCRALIFLLKCALYCLKPLGFDVLEGVDTGM